MQRAAGTGIVELTVAAALGLALLGVLTSITGYSARAVAGVERHLEAMHAAQMDLERLENDLGRAVLRNAQDRSLFDGATVSRGALDTISWRVAVPGPGGREPVYAGLPVVYSRVAAGPRGLFHLARNGRPTGAALLASLAFRLESVPGLAPGRRLYFVRTRLTGVAAAGGQEFVLDALTAVDPLCRWSAGQASNPNPDDQAPVLALAPAP